MFLHADGILPSVSCNEASPFQDQFNNPGKASQYSTMPIPADTSQHIPYQGTHGEYS